MIMGIDSKTAITVFETATVAFIVVALMGLKFIPFLKKLKFGQEVRDCGPEAHLKKQGTPTMGGIMILAGIVLASVIGFAAMKEISETALQILFLTLAYGLIGFADDYLKIRRHNSAGLSAGAKLALQLAAAVGFAVWAYLRPSEGITAGRVLIPFTGIGETAAGFTLPIWAFIPFAVLVILGTDNGVNFTDGLDGLCSSVTAVVAVFFVVAGLLIAKGAALVSAAAAGALAGFLVFNAYPAKVFMGDTGSLALGGFVAACAVVTGSELYILIFGLVYLVEVLSVILQVGYFKLTHGKRIFKMAPIHHHFELCGNSETRIVTVFTVITAFLAALSLIGLFFI